MCGSRTVNPGFSGRLTLGAENTVVKKLEHCCGALTLCVASFPSCLAADPTNCSHDFGQSPILMKLRDGMHLLAIALSNEKI